MTAAEQRAAAKRFVENWTGKGYEKGQSQPFWLQLLGEVYGVEHPAQFISFEDQVRLDHTSFIDGSIPSTHVLIEQKGLNKDLKEPLRQSDGSRLTPFEQAKRYAAELPYSQRPRWIVTCNFAEFHVYDMERPTGDPEVVLLKNLEEDYYRLQFLVDTGNEHIKKEMEISLKAGELVGKMYDALLKQYKAPEDPETLKSLNMLCVRLVFCLYAEDAGIFGSHGKFHDYLRRFEARDIRKALIDLFQVLDTKPEDRDPYMDEELAAFPYVNGGLFEDEDIIIPRFTDEIINLMLRDASEDFNWSSISPTIFGAVFESTLNPETRRKGGMHYTSVENIHKVIDPLFLDQLKDEFAEISAIVVDKTRMARLAAFQRKIAGLKFLDPACGSGNFLTETYISLRRLENQVIDLLYAGQVTMGEATDPIKVSIGQFYGIEINDFAVTVAKTALWIAESQMLKETEDIVHMDLDFLPLKSYANIVEGNALRLDWETVVPKSELNYIMGNPPFLGKNEQDSTQKEDLLLVFGAKHKGLRNMDYVSGWYKKAAEYITKTSIRCAFVSTNSITQGEQVPLLWKTLFAEGLHFDFAYRTFQWDSEANIKAHVHCIIIGFSLAPNSCPKKLYMHNNIMREVNNINAYLVDGPNVFVESRKFPLCDIPLMSFGSMPNDGGFLCKYSQEDMDSIVSKYPEATEMFRPFVGATEYLHNKKRFCLWLKDAPSSSIKKVPPVVNAIAACKKIRIDSSRKETQKLADVPYLFGEIRQPDGEYIIIPRHSSQNRKYIPMGYMDKETICGDSNVLIANPSMYHLGILMSNVHMAWMRAVCGRIKSDYRYSAEVVYNNFPWPSPTDEQRARIEKTAQGILEARAMCPNDSLDEMYDDNVMKKELLYAHRKNDRAVWEAYGKMWDITSETACVAVLMKMYQDLMSLQ